LGDASASLAGTPIWESWRNPHRSVGPWPGGRLKLDDRESGTSSLQVGWAKSKPPGCSDQATDREMPHSKAALKAGTIFLFDR